MTEHMILIAHGSSRARWRAAIERLGARVSAALAQPVGLAYMELCPPDLATAAAAAIEQGARRLRVLPLFWSGGGHVERDITAQVAALRARWPDVTVELEPAIGEHPRMVAALVEIAQAVGDPPS